MKKAIVFIVLGILSAITAVICFNAAQRGVGDMEVVKGEMVVEEGAADEDFQIQTGAALLIRKVEMFQYKEDTTTTRGYETGFYDKQMPSFYVETSKGKEKHYKNPSFPKGLTNEIFYGQVRLGDSGLYVANEMLEKLSYSSYVDFKDSHFQVLLKDLPADGGQDYGLKLYDGFYADKAEGWTPEKGWKVGDVRVRFYTVMPREGTTYTVAGDINDGVIGEGREDNVSYIYDYDVDKTAEEIAQEFESGNRNIGIGACVVAAIFLLLGFVFLRRARKE